MAMGWKKHITWFKFKCKDGKMMVWWLTLVANRLNNKRLQWSSGSVLPLSAQVRGFKPRKSCPDFLGWKNPQHTFLRKGSKAVGPMSQICGTQKIPELTWKLQSQAKLPVNSRPHSSTFH
jgi:hypothetical protein